MQASVELCGGSHMNESSQAQTFVLASEEGIAKGIRRIVGLTGETARKAQELAREYEDRVRDLSALISKQDDQSIRQALEMERLIRSGLESVTISQIAKTKLRAELDAVNKVIIKKQKESDKAQSELLAKKLMEVGKSQNCHVMVIDIESNEGDAKTIIKVAQDVADKRKICVFLFLKEQENFSGCAVVPDNFVDKLKANEWVAQLEAGKGGGKPNQASVRGPIELLQQAMTKARDIAKHADGSWVIV